MQFINRCIETIKHVFLAPKKLFVFGKESFFDFKNNLETLPHHLKNLKAANMELGLYHLKIGNLSDAKLRFWLVYKFFAKEEKEAFYFDAWAKMLSGEYMKARGVAKLAKQEDKVSLGKYLSEYDLLGEIPYQIGNQYYELSSNYYFARYEEKKISAVHKFTSALLPYLTDGEKEFKVLDIGGNSFSTEEILEHLGKVEKSNSFRVL